MYGSSCYCSVYRRNDDSNGLGVQQIITLNKQISFKLSNNKIVKNVEKSNEITFFHGKIK